MAEKRDRYGVRGDPTIAPGGNGYGTGNGIGGRGFNGRAPPGPGFDADDSSFLGRGKERYDSMPPNTPMTPYTPYTPYTPHTPYTPMTMGYDGGESSLSIGTPRHDRYYGGESAVAGRPAAAPANAGYQGGASSYNVGTPRNERYDGRETYVERRDPRLGYHPAESTISADTPRTGRFDPAMESSIAHPDTPRTAHYDTTATTMSVDPSRTGTYDKDNTTTAAPYYDPAQARERERQMMEREKFEREGGMHGSPGMEHGPPRIDYLSTSGSSTSSYLDISRNYPTNYPTKGFSFRSFFTTPSEKSDSKKKKEKKKSKKLTKHNSSSSSSLNEDLAFGTGFLRYRRKRSVRARDGRDRQWETVGYRSSKENLRDTRPATNERPTSGKRLATDAEILAVGAGLAKLARDHIKKERIGKNGRGVRESTSSSRRRASRETDHNNDDDAWESASDDESDSSVDAGLAFGGGSNVSKSKSGFFGRKRVHGPKSRKSSVVDPRLLGPVNSLNGYLSDRQVGFEDVQWESGSDFGQQTYTPCSHPDRYVHEVYVHEERIRISRTQSGGSGSQTPLQQVFPVPTDDPSRFDAARASSSEYNIPRSAPVPLQQPQPITPVSQSVYHEPSYVRSESGGILKNSSARPKSLAGAAFAGVAAAAFGAVIARRDEKENSREDDRRDNRSYSESAISRQDEYRRERREDHYSIADSSISKPRDDDRKERRRDYDQSSIADSNLTWDEKREKRREERRKDDSRSSTSNSDRDRNRERTRDDPDAAAEERERRRRERREERRAPDRIEDNYEERRTHVLSEISAIARTPADPFQYQLTDSPTREESSNRQSKEQSTPSIVTIAREPDFSSKQSSSIKDPSPASRSEPPIDVSDDDDREQQRRDKVKALHDAEHSTAPIEAAAILAAATVVIRESSRESISYIRGSERRTDSEGVPKDEVSTNGPGKSRDEVMEEADRAYREIVMARKVAAEVRRSRTPSPERSIMDKYEEEPEEEPPRIVTPPGMHERKKGPYDAPNADFKLDFIMTPKDFKVYSIPSRRYKVDEADLKGPFMTKDADAKLRRPLLNLVVPTPTSTPSPEKQFVTAVKNGNGNRKTDSSSRSHDRSNERRRSEPQPEPQPEPAREPEPEPEPERYSKPTVEDEEREQVATRSQNEPTQPRAEYRDREQTQSYSLVNESTDRTQTREQMSSYSLVDDPRDRDHDLEQAQSYQLKDEPRVTILDREQAESYSLVDEPRDRDHDREQAQSYQLKDEPRVTILDREQAESYSLVDEPRDRDHDREQAQSYQLKDEPRVTILDREQAQSYGLEDEPRDRNQTLEQIPSYPSEDEPRDQDRRKRNIRDIPPIVVAPRLDLVRSSEVSVPSPTQSTVSKAVTWGPNETKHFEVESPTEPRDEFISDSFISDSSPETPEKPRYSEPRSEPESEPKSPGGWAAMAAGIIGAGAAVESPIGSPRRPEVSELARILKAREKERNERAYEYRGVMVEPESPYGEPRRESPPRDMRRDSLPHGVTVEPENYRAESRRESPPRDARRESLPENMRRDSPPRDTGSQYYPQATRRDSPPSVGPKPASLQSSHMPGSFDDDLDFTATVAAGLQDTGFDPDLVIEDPAFRKRDSPPGSNEYAYKAPRAESITDLASTTGEESSNRGFVMGEVPETPKDWSSVSPANDESSRLARKEQKKRDKERRRSGGDVYSPMTDVIVEEPESYFDSSRQSRKEQKKRDKEEARRQSLLREESSFVDISPDGEFVEEPESYIEPVDTPEKSKKPSRSSTYDNDDFDPSVSTPKRRSSKRSLTYDGKVESSLRESHRSSLRESHRSYSLDDVKNGDESKIPRKSKDRSQSRTDSSDPSQVPLPSSESSREDLDLSRELERSSRREGDLMWASSRSILSADSSSKFDEEDSPQKSRKDRSGIKDDNDSARLAASEPTRNENEDPKKKAKETAPRKVGGLFGFFSGSRGDTAKEEPAKGTRDDADEAKKEKRSSTSDGITGSQPFGDLTQVASNETNSQRSRGEDGEQEFRNDGEKKRSKSSDSKKGSFLDNAGILGAGAGLAAGAIAISAQHQQQNAANNNDSEGTTGAMGSMGKGGEQEMEEEILDPEIIERQIRPSIDPQYGDLLPLPPSGPVSPNFEPIDDLPKLPESRPGTPESEKRTVGTPREKTPRNRKSLQETPVKSPSQSAVPLKFVMGNRSNPASPIMTRSTGNTPFPAFQFAPIPESAIIPRSRSRPMSWDNTKEFQPLYLLETNKRGSFVPEELVEPLPHLPPSRTNSELDVADLPESGFLEELDLHRPSLDPLSTNLPSDDLASGESTPTTITFRKNLAPSVEFLRDSFPSLEETQNLSSDVHSREQSPSKSATQAIGVAAIATAAGLATASHDTSNEQEPESFHQIQDKSGDNSSESFESHDIAATREKSLQTLSETSNKQDMSFEEELKPTEEFPLFEPRKNENIGEGLPLASDDINDQAENIWEPIQELELDSSPLEAENSEPVDEVSIPKSKEKKGKKGEAESLGTEPDPKPEIQTITPGQEDTQELNLDHASSEQHNVTELGQDIFEEVATPVDVDPLGFPTEFKNENTNEETDKIDLSSEPEFEMETVDSIEPSEPMDKSPLDDMPDDHQQQQVPQSSQEIVQEPLPWVEHGSVEESSIFKSETDKEDAGNITSEMEELYSESVVENTIEMPIQERSREESPELHRDISEPSSPLINPNSPTISDSTLPETPGDITPIVDVFASSKSNRDEEKAMKARLNSLHPEQEELVIEPRHNQPAVSQIQEDTPVDLSQDPVEESIADPATPADVNPVEEFLTMQPKEDKEDKEQTKQEQTTDVEQKISPVDTIQEQEQLPEVQEDDVVEKPVLEDTPKLDDIPGGFAPASPKQNEDESEKSKAADLEQPVESPIPSLIPERLSEKPTPMIGPGGWPATPESVSENPTPVTGPNGSPETPTAPRTDTTKETSKSNVNNHLPSAEPIIPVVPAVTAALSAAQLKSDEISQEKVGPDGLTSGYSKDQLSPEEQLQEESEVDIMTEDTPKDLVEDVTKLDELPGGYQEDELAPARQLPAELVEESQEEKERHGAPQTPQDEQAQFFDELGQTPGAEPQNEEESIITDSETPNGLDAGSQEDELTLVEQSEQDFESITGKEKEHVNQNEDGQLPSDIKPSDNAIKELNEQTDMPVSQPEIIEDLTNKPVLEEPKEIDTTDEKQQILDESAPVDDIINEPTVLEETPSITQEQEKIENVHFDPVIAEPGIPDKTLVDPIITTPEAEALTPSKKSEEQTKGDSLPSSDFPEEIMEPEIVEGMKPIDVPDQQTSEDSSILIDPEAEFATPDKNQDNMIEPTHVEDASLSPTVDEVKNGEANIETAKAADIQQEIAVTLEEPSTVNRGIEFSAPPKRSKKDKNQRGKQEQDSIEDDIVPRDITPADESSNTEPPAEQPNNAPVEQIITIPAKGLAPYDVPAAPMTAGLSGLMGPLTGRRLGVVEMVQALGWGKRKDNAAIAAAEQGLPPRPSTARPASGSYMSETHGFPDFSMLNAVEDEPTTTLTPTSKLREWALPDKDSEEMSEKGENIVSPETEPIPSIVVEEEPLSTKPKKDTVEKFMESRATEPNEDLQGDQLFERRPGRRRRSILSYLPEEAFKAMRGEFVISEPKTPSLTVDRVFIEQSREITSEPIFDKPVQEEKGSESVLEVSSKQSTKGNEEHQILQSSVSEDMPKEEVVDASKDAATEEPKIQTPENHELFVEHSHEPLEIPHEPVSEDFEAAEVPSEDASEAIVDKSSDPKKLHREVAQEDGSVPQPQTEQILEPMVEEPSEPSKFNGATDATDQENPSMSEPILGRSSELTETPRDFSQEDVFAPQKSIGHVLEPSATGNESSLPTESIFDEVTKNVEISEPSHIDESSLPEKTIPDDIMASVEYLEPNTDLQDTYLTREPLSGKSDNNIESVMPNTVDDSPLSGQITPQDSINMEISEPIYTAEGDFLPTESATHTDTAQPESSEILNAEESETEHKPVLRGSNTSRKSKEDKFGSEPEVSTEVTQEPEQPILAEEPISEEPLEATQSIDREIFEQPVEKSIESSEPEIRDYLDPASVPLPEDPVTVSTEFNEPALIPLPEESFNDFVELSNPASVPLPEESFDEYTEVNEPISIPLPEDPINKFNEFNEAILVPLPEDPFEEYIEVDGPSFIPLPEDSLNEFIEITEPASVPLPEDSFDMFAELNEPALMAPQKIIINQSVTGPASIPLPEDSVDEFIELDEPTNSDVPKPYVKHSSSNSFPRKYIVNPEVREPKIRENLDDLEHAASIPLPEDTAEQTMERPSDVKVPANGELSDFSGPLSPVFAPVLLPGESLPSKPYAKTGIRAAELESEEVPLISDVPISEPFNETTFNKPQESEVIPAEPSQETEQTPVESTTELIVTPRNIETNEAISKDKFVEPAGDFSMEAYDEDEKKPKSEVAMPSAEDISTQTSMKSSSSHDADEMPPQANAQDSMQSVPENQQTSDENTILLTLKEVDAKQDNNSEAALKPSLESQEDIESASSQPIVQPPAEELHRNITNEETTNTKAEPIIYQEQTFEPRLAKEDSKPFEEPVIGSMLSQPQTGILQEPVFESENVREEAPVLQELIAPQNPSIELRITNEEPIPSSLPIMEPDIETEEAAVPLKSTIESNTNDQEPFPSWDPITEPEIMREELLIPEESTFESKEESFVPQESRINEEEPTLQQELEIESKVSDRPVSLVQGSATGPILWEEQPVIRKPVIEVNNPKPEEIALPESPTESKSFEPEMTLPQGSVVPIVQERAIDPQRPYLKLDVPQVVSLEQDGVAPERIPLPGSLIEQEVFRPEHIPLPESPIEQSVVEPERIPLSGSPIEQEVFEPEHIPLPESPIEQSVVEPEQIPLPKSPIYRELSELEIPFQREPVYDSHIFEEPMLTQERLIEPEMSSLEPVIPRELLLEHKLPEPEQIPLPESPLHQETFGLEALFRQEPGAEPFISDVMKPMQDEPSNESHSTMTETRENEWAWPAEESKEEKNGENVATSTKKPFDVAHQSENLGNAPLEITEPLSARDDAKEPVQEVSAEPDEESFFDVVEYFTKEEIKTHLAPRISQEQDVVPSLKEFMLHEYKAVPADELEKVDLPPEMLIEERAQGEHRPSEDDVTGVLTKNSKDINDREFGFSSPVQFIPKDTQLGVPDVEDLVPTEIIVDKFKAKPTEEMPKEVQQQTKGEWGPVSTKKSEWDMKKHESSLSTPLEPEVPNVATELPEDTPSNSGKPGGLLPTVDDVSDTHTSFQIPQVETLVRADDNFGTSPDKKWKEIPSRELDIESRPLAVPNTDTTSETQDVKPADRFLASPIPMRDIVQAFKPIAEPKIILPITSSSPSKPISDEPYNISADLSQIGSKKDKRKRQATLNLETPKDDRSIFWADEVPEAEVVRAVPVIEDIGRDEFYSHIASTVKKPQTNEFSRPPAKKGKKNTNRESFNVEDFRLLIGADLQKIEPMKERKEMLYVVPASAAIANAEVLVGGSKEPEVEPVREEENQPMQALLDNGEKRQDMDKGRPSDDIFDHSGLDDKDRNTSEETKDGFGQPISNGFREEHTILQGPEQIEKIQEPMIEQHGESESQEEPEQTERTQELMIEGPGKSAIVEARETRTPAPLSHVLDNADFFQEPEQLETTQEKTIAESLAEPMINIVQESEQMELPQDREARIPAQPKVVETTILQEPKQMETVQEPMIQIPVRPLIVEGRETGIPTPLRDSISDDERQLEIETTPASKSYASSMSPSPRRSPTAQEARGDLPEEYLSRRSRRDTDKRRRKTSIEVENEQDLLPAPIQEALRNIIVEPRARRISPSPSPSPTAERAKRARSRSRPPSRPGTPGLTMLQEEPEEEHAQNIGNRDSAFVNDSPIPLQGNFANKHELVRDSAIHLRDNSPSMRVRSPVSSADAAIDSMEWPPVDEDAGTVDLEQPPRPKVVENLKRHDHGIDDLPYQRHREEEHTDLQRAQTIHGMHSPLEGKHKLTRKSSLTRGELAEANHVDFVRSQRLKAFQTKSKEKLSEPHQAEPINKSVTPEKEHTRHRVHRSEFPDAHYRKPKENKYGDLESVKTPRAEQRSISESPPALVGSAALAAAGLGFAAARRSSQESRPLSAQSHKSQRPASNISVARLRTPAPLDAPHQPQFPDSASTNRSFTPPLRRTARKISGDLKSLRQQSNIDLAKEIGPASLDTATSTTSTNSANPTANEGRARAQEMADVYDGYGEGHMGSPRSPTRPHSMRRRQSMQVLELESKLDQLTAENRALAEAKAHAEHMLRSSQGAPAALVERDAEIDLLKRTLSSMQDEVKRLTEVNAGLTSAAITLGQQHNARYGILESQHAQTSRELQQAREAHHNLQNEVEGIIHNAIQERDQEIASLRSQLDVAKEQIRAMQREILAAKAGDTQFLTIRDEDYFDGACQQLCQHVQQWVLRFSKFSDMRACRLTREINNDKTIDRLDNAILDGSDVDNYLADRVRRRDVFMSMTMTMVWEFIFTRYLFGMDREQRQKLKSLEKLLSEVGPSSAVHQWRATTLTLLSKRESFARQREQDTLAVVHAILETLTEILPPPSHLEDQIEEQLKRVVKAAVVLSIEMRTQRAEYMMLPPLQPEYDANGDLASKVSFNAALMNERSGDTVSNEELEAQKAVVRVVLFPLVVKKGDDLGQGDEEIVVCPAQVLVAKPRMGKGPVGRVYSPASGDVDRRSSSRTPASMQSSMPDTNVI
ncbi:6d15dbc5-8656-4ffe-8f41-9f889979efd5 [Sclerotinia trifoliorum]|uniref:6d15dbc5-8656-4ffe-8f41-9f889979efd5 n=1 Tax=Sclerotinia trifoliorum TaxID=28548 RepID=A0A8H2ZKZ7_9HELO|nr:6d15dbc5-8656-4ffe-8f41-9f889979efd5 [Sclerotinia trifoliorum]